MGYSTSELLKEFYQMESISFNKDGSYSRKLDFNLLIGTRANTDILDKSGASIVKKGKNIQKLLLKKWKTLN